MSEPQDEQFYQQWLTERREVPESDVSGAVLAELLNQDVNKTRVDRPEQQPRQATSRLPQLLFSCAKFAAIAGAMLLGLFRWSWFLLPLTELG